MSSKVLVYSTNRGEVTPTQKRFSLLSKHGVWKLLFNAVLECLRSLSGIVGTAVFLIRDRFGEKPLYWGLSGFGDDQALLFGSELSALRAWPGFNNDVHRPAVAQYFRFGSLSAPSCIYTGIHQLLPGHLVTIQYPLTKRLPESQPWWCFRSLVAKSVADPFVDPSAGLDALESALCLSVHQQSLADVPLGSFLSGGVDSSLITALLQSQSNSPVSTFTIGFEENGFNEAPYASAVASHLGTDHTEIILTAADAQSLIPQLPLLYSEPFADSSGSCLLIWCAGKLAEVALKLPSVGMAEMSFLEVTTAISVTAYLESFGMAAMVLALSPRFNCTYSSTCWLGPAHSFTANFPVWP